jgi:hypothetical protein
MRITPASSTIKTGRHDIAESGVKHQKFKFKLCDPTEKQYLTIHINNRTI